MANKELVAMSGSLDRLTIFDNLALSLTQFSLLLVAIYVSRPIFLAIIHYDFAQKRYISTKHFRIEHFTNTYRTFRERIKSLITGLFNLVDQGQFLSVLSLSLIYTLSFIFAAQCFGWGGSLVGVKLDGFEVGQLSQVTVPWLTSLEIDAFGQREWLAGIFKLGVICGVILSIWLIWNSTLIKTPVFDRSLGGRVAGRCLLWLLLPTVALLPRLSEFLIARNDTALAEFPDDPEWAAISVTISLIIFHMMTAQYYRQRANCRAPDQAVVESNTAEFPSDALRMAIVGAVALLLAHFGWVVAGIAVVVFSAFCGFGLPAGGFTVLTAMLVSLPIFWSISMALFVITIIGIFMLAIFNYFYIHPNRQRGLVHFCAKFGTMAGSGAAAFSLLGSYIYPDFTNSRVFLVIVIVWIVLPLSNACIDYWSWRFTRRLLDQSTLKKAAGPAREARVQISKRNRRRSSDHELLRPFGLLLADLSKGLIFVVLAVETYIMATTCYFAYIGLADFDLEIWVSAGARSPFEQEVVWFTILSLTALFPSLLHAIALPEALCAISRGGATADTPSGIASLLSAPAAIVFVIAGVLAVLEAVGVGWLSVLVLKIFFL